LSVSGAAAVGIAAMAKIVNKLTSIISLHDSFRVFIVPPFGS